MLRTHVIPKDTELHISIPKDYIGREIEVLLFATDEPKDERKEAVNTMAHFWNVLSPATTELLQKETEQSRNEWQ